MPKTPREPKSKNLLKRGGITGIAMGVLALLACELPIILAIIGFGGLSASAMIFKPSPMLELFAVTLIVIGAITLISLWVIRKRKLRKASLQ